jgi:hypothetical protein
MTEIAHARATLLRALESIDAAEGDLGGKAERCDLVVVYSVGRREDGDGAWHDVGGWASTPGPKWVHAALLRRAADANDDASYAVDDEPDDDA